MITELTWQQAEQQFDCRVDRRRKYATDGEQLLELAQWSSQCSGCGCDCGDSYPCGHGNSGCDECGYTGRRKHRIWIPQYLAESCRLTT